MDLYLDDVIKLLLAILLGGMIGFEREFRDKAAGFRTIIFICVGATLFTIFSIRIAGDKDPGRIAANIVTGVGFLGAGVVLRNEGRIVGLTTASIVWLTAAIGMGIGSNQYALAFTTALFMFLILWVFPYIERIINNFREERIYEITWVGRPGKFEELDILIHKLNLYIRSKKRNKSGNDLIYILDIVGSPRNHNLLVNSLIADQDIQKIIS